MATKPAILGYSEVCYTLPFSSEISYPRVEDYVPVTTPVSSYGSIVQMTSLRSFGKDSYLLAIQTSDGLGILCICLSICLCLVNMLGQLCSTNLRYNWLDIIG